MNWFCLVVSQAAAVVANMGLIAGVEEYRRSQKRLVVTCNR